MTIESAAQAINAWQVAQDQFDLAAEMLNLDPCLRAVLRGARRELTVHFPVHMDDGSVQVFTGYRIQHNLGRGPVKGASATTSTLSKLPRRLSWRVRIPNQVSTWFHGLHGRPSTPCGSRPR